MTFLLAGAGVILAAGCCVLNPDLADLLSASIKIASNPADPPIGELTAAEWVVISRHLPEVAQRFSELHLPQEQVADLPFLTYEQANALVAFLDDRGINNLSDLENLAAYVPPEQSQFASLDSLSSSGAAFVRLYAAPVLGLETVAIHAWFVVKRADSTTFHRWECWEVGGGPFGHVWEDRVPLTYDLGTGSYALTELSGSEAEPVVAFIESQSPAYPCSDVYAWFPGPNSNTYIQWVLDGSGWNVELPAATWGKDFAVNCSSTAPAPDPWGASQQP